MVKLLISGMVKYKVTEYFKSLSHEGSGLWKQFYPDPRESIFKDYELEDPLSENKYLVSPRLVHRYKDRVLMLVTDQCLMYCRHCFRKDFIDRGINEISDSEIDLACEYIKKHSEVHEVILSGGDPLTISECKLSSVLKKIRQIRPGLIIRIGTRIPVVEPGLITDGLINILKENSPLWFLLQINHPDELTPDSVAALKRLNMAGVGLLNQSVLLKGINDSVDILKRLYQGLLEVMVKPYYIFQGDLARGTSHLRVPISRGLEIINELKGEISGIAMPIYAVDIPGGGGKIHLNRESIINEDDEFYYLQNSDGFVGKYPKE